MDQNDRPFEIEVCPSETEDLADSQSEAQSNEHHCSIWLNKFVEDSPGVLHLKNARTSPPLADAFHFDQFHRIALNIQQFPQHRFVEETVHQRTDMAFVLW